MIKKKILFSRLSAFLIALFVDLKIILNDLPSALFDTVIWVTLSIFCNSYVLPELGLTTKFGSLLAVGQVVSCGIFLSYSAAVVLTKDLDGDSVITFELMLPLPAWSIFLKKALAWAVKSMCLSAIVLPISKVVLMNRLVFVNFCYWKFFIAFLLVNFFAGIFAIFAASINKSILTINSVWVRFLYPMWFLGGSIFPYNVVSEAFPTLGKLLLLNPVVYSTEMLRSAVLGVGSHKLFFWHSFFALVGFSIIFFIISVHKFRKKLDFI